MDQNNKTALCYNVTLIWHSIRPATAMANVDLDLPVRQKKTKAVSVLSLSRSCLQ